MRAPRLASHVSRPTPEPLAEPVAVGARAQAFDQIGERLLFGSLGLLALVLVTIVTVWIF